MVSQNYTDEFCRWAVDLYESTPGATLLGIAADRGISRGALKEWVHRLGCGVATADNAKVTTVAGRSGLQEIGRAHV